MYSFGLALPFSSVTRLLDRTGPWYRKRFDEKKAEKG
jgi:hypothetical protein